MIQTKKYQFWFATGSQDLYGEETLVQVAEHSRVIVEELNKSGNLPFEVVLKPTLIDSASIRRCFNEANADELCAGVITWMHTFSPAKMWILGLQEYRKPLLHLHTQFNRDIPYDSIDMDFMNLNQSAHGDREFGHIVSRMGIERKVIVGHWSDVKVQQRIGSFMRTAVGVMESSHIRVLRVGDNMRDVAVTEGDKVEAEDGRDPEDFKAHVREQAAIEVGFRKFVEEHDYHAVVTSFQMLSGLNQLPGLAMQRMMADGYGFGAEGDWKTAAMVRLMKIMAEGTKDAKGTSFMEDYTYHFEPGREAILQSHMLEVCPSIAEGKPSIRVMPLSMGNREDPARLVFTTKPGRGVACSLVDLGTRFRLIINDVETLKQDKAMPNLPVASALWRPEPNLMTGAEAWILAGGAHHTAFSLDLTAEQMGDWGAMMGIECVFIDKDTTIRNFKNELCWNEIAFR